MFAQAVREMIASELDRLRAEMLAALEEHERKEGGEWLPSEVAARRLNITREALYMRIKRGVIPASKRGRRWFVSVADLNTELERRRRRHS